MLEKCQKSPTILQFLEGPMFLNPLILLEEEPPEDHSLIDPEISLLVLREFLRVESLSPWYGGVCPGS